MNGISVLVKEALRSSRVPSIRRGHTEKLAVQEPGSGSSPVSGLCQHRDLGLPSLWNSEKSMFVVYKSCSLWSFCEGAGPGPLTALSGATGGFFSEGCHCHFTADDPRPLWETKQLKPKKVLNFCSLQSNVLRAPQHPKPGRKNYCPGPTAAHGSFRPQCGPLPGASLV